MLNTIFRYTRFALLVILAGYGAPNEGQDNIETPKPTNGDALVYIYRPAALPMFHSPTIYVNATEIGDLSRKEYTYIYVKPGDYVIRTKWSFLAHVKDQEFKLSVTAGESYFVRLTGTWEMSPGWSGTTVTIFSSLGTIPEDIARSEIGKCTYFKPTIERFQ